MITFKRVNQNPFKEEDKVFAVHIPFSSVAYDCGDGLVLSSIERYFSTNPEEPLSELASGEVGNTISSYDMSNLFMITKLDGTSPEYPMKWEDDLISELHPNDCTLCGDDACADLEEVYAEIAKRKRLQHNRITLFFYQEGRNLPVIRVWRVLEDTIDIEFYGYSEDLGFCPCGERGCGESTRITQGHDFSKNVGYFSSEDLDRDWIF